MQESSTLQSSFEYHKDLENQQWHSFEQQNCRVVGHDSRSSQTRVQPFESVGEKSFLHRGDFTKVICMDSFIGDSSITGDESSTTGKTNMTPLLVTTPLYFAVEPCHYHFTLLQSHLHRKKIRQVSVVSPWSSCS